MLIMMPLALFSPLNLIEQEGDERRGEARRALLEFGHLKNDFEEEPQQQEHSCNMSG